MKIEPYKEKYADVRDAINYLLQFKNGIVLEPMPQVDCKLAHSEDVDIFVFDFRMRFWSKSTIVQGNRSSLKECSFGFQTTKDSLMGMMVEEVCCTLSGTVLQLLRAVLSICMATV